MNLAARVSLLCQTVDFALVHREGGPQVSLKGKGGNLHKFEDYNLESQGLARLICAKFARQRIAVGTFSPGVACRPPGPDGRFRARPSRGWPASLVLIPPASLSPPTRFGESVRVEGCGSCSRLRREGGRKVERLGLRVKGLVMSAYG